MTPMTTQKNDVVVNVMTMTVTFVTNTVFNMLFRIVNERDLSPQYLNENRKVVEDGLFTWVSEQSLLKFILEVFQDDREKALEKFEFSFDYVADPSMEPRQPPIAELATFAQTLQNLPPGTKYRVVVELRDGATEVPGWSPTTLRDLDIFKDEHLTDWGFGNANIKLAYKGGKW